MKHSFVSLLLMIVLLLSITAEAEDRFTISEIYEQYNGQRWQESYQTVRNETVTIDAPFIIPHVESAPVIRWGTIRRLIRRFATLMVLIPGQPANMWMPGPDLTGEILHWRWISIGNLRSQINTLGDATSGETYSYRRKLTGTSMQKITT